jgi:transposase
MVPRSSSAPQAPTSAAPVRIGVGIDTSRYGHYAVFLRDDLQPAAAELPFAESAAGYAQLRQTFQRLSQRHGDVHFVVRLDVAGSYADNLRHFLQELSTPRGQAPWLALTVSCGDPQRNKNYRAAVFGAQKSDPVEARAMARFALAERPASDTPLSAELRIVRQVAGRLQAVVRQRTRLINQLHHLLALTFPELALLTKDLAAGWVLELLHRYPTAPLLAQASSDDLQNVPYLPGALVEPLRDAARTSIGSLSGTTIEELIRDQVRQLRDASARQKRLESLLISAFRALPVTNHLDTIPGIGAVTAAVLTAFILDIDRFDAPGRLVKYFGTMPIEISSGIDRDGQARGPKRFVMTARGNDLVRRYLWMAALSAIRFNPAVRALYARVVAKHPDRKAIAVGHAMRKLLHLVFAIWKSGKPFDATHYDWDRPAHVTPLAPGGRGDGGEGDGAPGSPEAAPAAGLRSGAGPVRQEVTAADAEIVSPGESPSDSLALDFAHLKRQLPLARVLDHLGLASRLKGAGPQRRGPCPIHRGDGRGRTFSVTLEKHAFHCFAAECGAKGDVIDLWAGVHRLSLREAALDLVRTFDLEPMPRGTEKRNG